MPRVRGADPGGHPVVLKIIHAHLIASDAIRSALLAQMRALVAVKHPNVLSHLDVVEEGGQLALVVDAPQGEMLRQRLARVQRLSWPEAVSVAVEIARGLAAVRAATPTVVHGDREPENILLTTQGSKLVDFDFTWTVKDAQGESTAGFRNLRYMSPEAIDAAGVEPRSDLYGLGLVLYEMVSGAPPFAASSPRELRSTSATVDLRCSEASEDGTGTGPDADTAPELTSGPGEPGTTTDETGAAGGGTIDRGCSCHSTLATRTRPMRIVRAVTDPDAIAAELHGACPPPRPSPPGQLKLFTPS